MRKPSFDFVLGLVSMIVAIAALLFAAVNARGQEYELTYQMPGYSYPATNFYGGFYYGQYPYYDFGAPPRYGYPYGGGYSAPWGYNPNPYGGYGGCPGHHGHR